MVLIYYSAKLTQDLVRTSVGRALESRVSWVRVPPRAALFPLLMIVLFAFILHRDVWCSCFACLALRCNVIVKTQTQAYQFFLEGGPQNSGSYLEYNHHHQTGDILETKS